MVKYSRDQSTEAPRRRIWSVMAEPYWRLPLPDAGGEDLATGGVCGWCLRRPSWRSTIICVAMPA